MNRKHFITLSLVAGIAFSMASAMAENSIYTDGIGRLHFLGKDVNDTKVQYNYANPEQQDLTRKLYENSTSEVNYVDHPLKNYDHTFGADRLDTQNMWKNKFQNNVQDAQVSGYKGTFGATNGNADDLSKSGLSKTINNSYESEKNIIKTTEKKKRWWRK